jgi:hypothetical protein
MISNFTSFIIGAALLWAWSSSSHAADAIKVCGIDVPVENIQVIQASEETNVSREQAELEQLGYIVQRCRTHLTEYDIRGIALVLHDVGGNVSSLIYRD